MTLEELVSSIPGFDTLGPTDKIRIFAWHLQRQKGRERFQLTDVTACFDELHLHRPPNVSQLLSQIVAKDLIKDAKGLRCGKTLLDLYDPLYGQRPQTVAVHKLLAGLPAQLTTLAETAYLTEAISCLRVGAFRAAIVMTWNVAYDHLLTVIMTKGLLRFNAALAQPNVLGGKKSAIALRDDFQKWREGEVVEACRLSGITSKEISKVLSEKLEKRNSAAHPSGSIFDQLMAEAYIADLIQNVTLKL